MKKLILGVFTLFMMTAMNAQQGFGAKAGLNIASLKADGIDNDSKMGAYFGVFYEYMISDQFAIQPELVYSMQGAKGEESEAGYSAEEKVKLDYINLPIMAKFYPIEDLYIVAGPQVGFNISAKYESKQTMDGQTVEAEGDIDNMKVDFSLGLGLGYSFTENIGAEARYNIGLSEIADDAVYKNSVAQIGLFYAF